MGSVSGTPFVVIVDVAVIVDIVEVVVADVADVAASWTRPSRTSAVLKVNISKVALSSEIFWPRQPQIKFTQIEAHPPKNDARPAVNAEISFHYTSSVSCPHKLLTQCFSTTVIRVKK